MVAENTQLLTLIDDQLNRLDPSDKAMKRKITALTKDRAVVAARIDGAEALMKQVGGPLTEDDARRLILKKVSDVALGELDRYVSAEVRALVGGLENLWQKYATSALRLEDDRATSLATVNKYLDELGYSG